jgi:hypothetical protein
MVDQFMFHSRLAFYYAQGDPEGKSALTRQLWQLEEGELFKRFYDEFRDTPRDINPSMLEAVKAFEIKGINTAGQSPAPAAYSGFPRQSRGVLNLF